MTIGLKYCIQKKKPDWIELLYKILPGAMLFCLLGFNSCKLLAQERKQGKDLSTENPATIKKEVPAQPIRKIKQRLAAPTIAPGHCRIIGKVIAISPEREANATNICGKTPCRAKIKIEKVIGYGHSFNETLAVGEEINAYFIFSLKPTEKLLPDLTTPLPGLKIGSSFQADIEPSTEVAGATNVSWYLVKIYQLI